MRRVDTRSAFPLTWLLLCVAAGSAGSAYAQDGGFVPGSDYPQDIAPPLAEVGTGETRSPSSSLGGDQPFSMSVEFGPEWSSSLYKGGGSAFGFFFDWIGWLHQGRAMRLGLSWRGRVTMMRLDGEQHTLPYEGISMNLGMGFGIRGAFRLADSLSWFVEPHLGMGGRVADIDRASGDELNYKSQGVFFLVDVVTGIEKRWDRLYLGLQLGADYQFGMPERSMEAVVIHRHPRAWAVRLALAAGVHL